jgi:hypothetical protein
MAANKQNRFSAVCCYIKWNQFQNSGFLSSFLVGKQAKRSLFGVSGLDRKNLHKFDILFISI